MLIYFFYTFFSKTSSILNRNLLKYNCNIFIINKGVLYKMEALLESINKKIEKERDALQTLLKFNYPTDDSVISCSQKLDKLLVKYESYKRM